MKMLSLLLLWVIVSAKVDVGTYRSSQDREESKCLERVKHS